MSFRAKIARLFGWHETRQQNRMVEQIREEMLSSLRAQCAHECIVLDRKISFAREIDDLWYFRSDLMQAIAASKGDGTACEELQRITSMFPWKETTAIPSRFTSR